MKIRIEPYKTWSGGAKALGERCGILRATRRQVRKHGDFDVIINWGRNERRFNGHYINEPERCILATDKKASLEVMEGAGVSVPPFTSDKAVAEEWLQGGQHVVARRLLRANSGRGIVLCTPENDEALPDAPLYTQYIKKAHEYRVHVVRTNVIDTQQKRQRTGLPEGACDFQIRNASNGWVYCREDVNPPECVLQEAVDAIQALGLDFGAVDVGYNMKHDRATVYEVNTAPGLEGTTLDKYYEAFCSMLPQINHGRYALRRRAHL